LKIFHSTIPDLRLIFASELTQKTTFMLSTLLFLGNLGAGEIFLVIALFVLFFGAKKIPELAKGIGRGIREFKDASKDIKDTIEEESRKQP
jgi:sec-independent protein translocase protein TatA